MKRTLQVLNITAGVIAWLTYLILASAVLNEPEHHWTRERVIHN